MRLTPLSRPQAAVFFFLLALILAFPLLYWWLQPTSVGYQTTLGGATLDLGEDRGWVEFPGECVVLRWHIEGIQAIRVNDQPRSGQDEREVCANNVIPNFKITFRDGSIHTYTLPVLQLYWNPVILAVLASAIFCLSAAAYLRFGVPGLLAALTILVGGPMIRGTVNLTQNYIDHNRFAAIIQSGDLSALRPHFLYHVFIVFLNDLFPFIDIENVSFLISLAAYVASALAIYTLLRWLVGVPSISETSSENSPNTASQPPALRESGPRGEDRRRILADLFYTALTLALLLTGPISYPVFRFGVSALSAFIDFNLSHSPTMTLLRPIALLLFFVVIKVLIEPPQSVRRYAAALVALTFLCVTAKPSYGMALMPSLALLVAYSFVRPIAINRRLMIGTIIVPTALLLIWQFFFWYGPMRGSRVAFAPLQLMVEWHVPWTLVIPELLLSCLFPLTVYLLYFSEARRDLAFNLSWLVFLVGTAYMYLLIEVPKQSFGNFTWSSRIALLILIVVAAGFLLRQYRRHQRRFQMAGKVDWRFWLCAGIFVLHLVNHLLVILISGPANVNFI
jgi:hypothetical protein